MTSYRNLFSILMIAVAFAALLWRLVAALGSPIPKRTTTQNLSLSAIIRSRICCIA